MAEDSDSSSSSLDTDNGTTKMKEKKETIFIEFMSYSNEYIKLRHQMHVNLARGHLNMARGSRSSLSRSPGKFRKHKIFNKEMAPLFGVVQRREGGDLELDRKSETISTKTKSTLRNRNEDLKEEEEKEETRCGSIIDPLTWFGSMVARPIGVAQKDFQKTLPILVEMANIQERLDQLNREWEAL